MSAPGGSTDLGFSLEEIRELLTLSDGRDTGVASVREIAAQRLADVEARLAELNRLRDGLKTLVDACPGHGDPDQCPDSQCLHEHPR